MITYVAFCALLKVESFYYLLNILKKVFSSKKKKEAPKNEEGVKQLDENIAQSENNNSKAE